MCECDTCQWFEGAIDFPNGYKEAGCRRSWLEAKERGDPKDILFWRLRMEIESMFKAKCYDSWDYAFTLSYIVDAYVNQISQRTGE